jgi:hypothetical protein
MKKEVILIALLLLPFAYGLYELPLYKDWVKSDQYFMIKNESYRAIYIRNANTTVVYFPDGVTAVIYTYNSTCAEQWIYQVCQTKQKFEKNGQPVPPDINDPYIDVMLYLEIKTSNLSLGINKIVSSKDAFVGDVIDVKTVIAKTGSMDITNISLVDSYSDDFAIDNVYGCDWIKNKIIWHGDLNNTNQFSCSYQLRPLRNTTYSNVANITYHVFGKLQSRSIVTKFTVLEKPLDVIIATNNNSLAIGDQLRINISLKALKEVYLERIDIDYPPYFRVLNKSEFMNSANGLSYVGKGMQKNDSKKFVVSLNSSFFSESDINISITYIYNNLEKTIFKNIPIEYYGKMFHVALLKKDSQSVLRVSNPSDEYFREIEIYVDSLGPFYISRIDSKSFKELNFDLLSEGKHNVSVKYRSVYGQILLNDYLLQYGQSTYNYTEDSNELKQNNSTTSKKPTNSNSSGFKFDIDPKILLIALGIIGIIIIIVILITSFGPKTKSSSLDKEIEKIKEEETRDDGLIEN